MVVIEKLRAVYGDELADNVKELSALRHRLIRSHRQDDVWEVDQLYALTDVMLSLYGPLLDVVEDLLDHHLQAEGSGAEPRSGNGA